MIYRDEICAKLVIIISEPICFNLASEQMSPFDFNCLSKLVRYYFSPKYEEVQESEQPCLTPLVSLSQLVANRNESKFRGQTL